MEFIRSVGFYVALSSTFCYGACSCDGVGKVLQEMEEGLDYPLLPCDLSQVPLLPYASVSFFLTYRSFFPPPVYHAPHSFSCIINFPSLLDCSHLQRYHVTFRL